MNVTASMTKKVIGTGVLSDKAPDLFKSNGTSPRYRGFASFGEDGSSSVILEVADTQYLKSKGLSGRKYLPSCCGMVFTGLTGGAFWMKGCKIPLDIVFLNDDDTVSRVYSMKVDGGEKMYRYGDEKTAIELQYGFCRRNGIEPGTKCKWRVW